MLLSFCHCITSQSPMLHIFSTNCSLSKEDYWILAFLYCFSQYVHCKSVKYKYLYHKMSLFSSYSSFLIFFWISGTDKGVSIHWTGPLDWTTGLQIKGVVLDTPTNLNIIYLFLMCKFESLMYTDLFCWEEKLLIWEYHASLNAGRQQGDSYPFFLETHNLALMIT